MEQTTKNLLNAPKCKFLAPRLDPVPFLLDESFDESECDSTSTNNDSPKWDKILKIKLTKQKNKTKKKKKKLKIKNSKKVN